MARPEGFEPPTAWFVEVTVENHLNRNSKLDGPPSPFLPLRTVESRQYSSKRYVFAAISTISKYAASVFVASLHCSSPRAASRVCAGTLSVRSRYLQLWRKIHWEDDYACEYQHSKAGTSAPSAHR